MPDFIPLTIDAYFDRIFYINLKRETERNTHMIGQFKKIGSTNFERIEATEFTELPEKVHYRNFIKNERKYLIGGLSCRASHIHCIRIAKERNYKRILILEDDIVFSQNPNQLLTLNRNKLADWDMLYFGGLIEPVFRNQIVGTYAYGVSSTIFDDIIYMADASGMEIDNFYAKILQHMSYNYNKYGQYNIVTIFPFNSIRPHNSFKSNIQG